MKIASVLICLCIYEFRIDGKLINSGVAKYIDGHAASFLKQYLKPLQNIAQEFPDRAIEIQLEVNGKPSMNSKKLPTPLLHKILNFYNDDKKYYGNIDIPILKTKKDDTKTTAPNSTNKQTTKPTTKGSTTTKKATTKAAITTKRTTTSATTIPPDPNKRPVYMNDLVNALNEFEKKIATTSTANPNDDMDTSSPSDISAILQDGNRPLLKKDLWLALGMKYENHMDKYGNGMEHSMYQRHSPKVSENDVITNLLRNGVRIQHTAPNPLENEELQWFQVKVPKN